MSGDDISFCAKNFGCHKSHVWLHVEAYDLTPYALTWLCVNGLINSVHKQMICKNCLYSDNSLLMLIAVIYNYAVIVHAHQGWRKQLQVE